MTNFLFLAPSHSVKSFIQLPIFNYLCLTPNSQTDPKLPKRELRKIPVPLSRDVRVLKSTVSQIRKAVLALERFAAYQQKELGKRKIPLEATPEEVKVPRFSPHLIRSLRKHLGISQKELAILVGVTVGAESLVSGMTNFLFLAPFRFGKIAYSTANI